MTAARKAGEGDAFGALGDVHRRAIVEMLASRPRSVREIADELPISRPAVSRHLRLLKDAGLVVDESVGTRRLYRLAEPGAQAARDYLERIWGHAAPRLGPPEDRATPGSPVPGTGIDAP